MLALLYLLHVDSKVSPFLRNISTVIDENIQRSASHFLHSFYSASSEHTFTEKKEKKYGPGSTLCIMGA